MAGPSRGRLGALALSLALVACSSEGESPPEPPSPAAVQATPEPGPPRPAPGGPAISLEARRATSDILRRVVEREAGDPANAWALAHGMLALGPDFKARDGRPALRVLADDFLEKDSAGPVFAKKRDDRPVEPHTDLILKTLLELGFDLDESLKPGVKLSDLLSASRSRFAPGRHEGKLTLPAPNDAPWSVQAWCQGTAAGAPPSWTSAAGTVTTEEVAGVLLGQLETETHFIRTALSTGGSFEKRKQGIFAYTCGGAHLFQGAAACASLGWPDRGNPGARIRNQIEVYLARVPVETRLVDKALGDHPQLAVLLHNQDIKFLGHLLEGLGKVERDGLWSPTSREQAILRDVEARLIANVLEMERMGAYKAGSMARFAASPDAFQLYLDLVGDAAHALHGLTLQASLDEKR